MQEMDPLDLLFERLVRAVRDKQPEFLARPFEVAELVALVPYRAVRAEGTVETNDDYAHALTRLLAGERGYLFADDLLQDDLRAELSSPNPDLAAWRAYLTARVTISQEHARKAGESMPPRRGAAAVRGAASAPRAALPRRSPRRSRSGRRSAAAQRPLDPQAETAPRSGAARAAATAGSRCPTIVPCTSVRAADRTCWRAAARRAAPNSSPAGSSAWRAAGSRHPDGARRARAS